MPRRQPGSFSEHPREHIAHARHNLAGVLLYRLGEKMTPQDRQNTWHVFGNLAIASAALSLERSGMRGIEESMAESLGEISGDMSRGQLFIGKVLTRDAVRLIFALQHVPDDAPELLLGARSRELDVEEFLSQAESLNPDYSPAAEYAGNGSEMFIGSYLRRLS